MMRETKQPRQKGNCTCQEDRKEKKSSSPRNNATGGVGREGVRRGSKGKSVA